MGKAKLVENIKFLLGEFHKNKYNEVHLGTLASHELSMAIWMAQQ